MQQIESPREPAEHLLPSHAAAQRAGVTVRTLHRWEAAGRISAVRTPGGHRRYRAADIDALLSGERVA